MNRPSQLLEIRRCFESGMRPLRKTFGVLSHFNRRFGLGFIVILVSWSSLGYSIAMGQFIPPNAPADGATPDQAAMDAARAFAYRDREANDLANAVQSALGRNQVAQAASILQRLLDLPNDTYLNEKDPRPGTLETGYLVTRRRWAENLLLSHSDLLENYLRLISPVAEQELAAAEQSRSPGQLLLVAKRYFPTPSGFRACEKLAARLFDSGETEFAASLIERLKGSPFHVPARTAEWFQKIDRRQKADDQQLKAARLRSRSWHDWLSAGGSLQNAKTAEGTSPLHHAVWKNPWPHVDLVGDVSLRQFEAWLEERPNGVVPVVGARPLVIGDQVVFLAPGGVRAVSRTTGESLWTIEAKAEPAQRPVSNFRSNRESLFEGPSAFVRTLLEGVIASEGTHLFFLQGTTAESAPPPFSPRFRERVRNGLSEIVAYRLAVSTENRKSGAIPAPAKVIGEPPVRVWSHSGNTAGDPFHEHRFLAAPVATQWAVYVQSEFQGTLFVSALVPATGDVLWMQPYSLASPNGDTFADTNRDSYPVIARGQIVVSSSRGDLAALDCVTGEINWNRYQPVMSLNAFNAMRGQRPNITISDLMQSNDPEGFGSPLMCDQNRLIHTGKKNGKVEILDLDRGTLLHEIARNQASYFLVSGGRLFSVKSAMVQAWSLETGTMLWEWNDPRFSPSGQGIAFQDRLVLPSGDGRWIDLKAEDGSIVGSRFGRTLPGPGHLVAARDVIVSLSANGVVGHIRSEAASELVALENSAVAPVTRAELKAQILALDGHLEGAYQSLKEGLAFERVSSKGLSPQLAAALQEVIYTRLQTGSGIPADLLNEMNDYIQNDSDRSRYLVALTEHLRKEKAWGALRDHLPKLLSRTQQGLLSGVPDSPDWFVSMPVRHRMLQNELPPVEADAYRQQLSGDFPEGSHPFLHRFIDPKPMTATVMFEAIQHQTAWRQFHAAEFLLLQQMKQPDDAVRFRAMRELCELWDQCGLSEDAARLFDTLRENSANAELGQKTLIADWGRAWSMRTLAGELWRRRQWEEGPFEIAETWQSPRERGLNRSTIVLPSSSRSEPRLPAGMVSPTNPVMGRSVYLAGSTLQLRHHSQTELPSIEVFDRAAGATLGHLLLTEDRKRKSFGDVSLQFPSLAGNQVGHLVTVPGTDCVQAYSLLQMGEEAPTWRYDGLETNDLKGSPVILGPGNSQVVMFHRGNTLITVDPLTGNPLWKRTTLPKSRLRIPTPIESTGRAWIIDQKLILFHSGMYRLLVLGAESGADLGTIPLPPNTRQVHTICGSVALLTIAIAGGNDIGIGPQIVHYDISSQKILYQTEAPSNNLVVAVSGLNDEYAYMTSRGQVRVLNSKNPAGRTLHLLKSPSSTAQMTQLSVFADANHYYLMPTYNGAGVIVRMRDTRFHVPLQDPGLPAFRGTGGLYAIDRKTGDLAWELGTGASHVVAPIETPGPFLISIYGLRDKQSGVPQGEIQLGMELIDRKTGHRLGAIEGLKMDRFNFVDIDGPQKTIRLKGEESTITLRLRTILETYGSVDAASSGANSLAR